MDFSFSLFPERASTHAGWVDAVFFYGLGITVFFTALICFLIVFFSIKYRRGSKADRSNPRTHNMSLEIAWIAVPLVLAMGMFFFSTYVYYHLYQFPGTPPRSTSWGASGCGRRSTPRAAARSTRCTCPWGGRCGSR
ncbi:MAG: cytochrome c oxidase subunit II transmembrane domain-containing protein [Isosphaeraceae bacterium]